MSTQPTKSSPLQAAREALDLLDTHLQEDRHGDIDGVDTIDAGLRAMASSLADHFDIPVPEGMRTVYIEDVLDALAARGLVEARASGLATKLQAYIVDATYHGLSREAIDGANTTCKELWDILNALLAKEETTDGS